MSSSCNALFGASSVLRYWLYVPTCWRTRMTQRFSCLYWTIAFYTLQQPSIQIHFTQNASTHSGPCLLIGGPLEGHELNLLNSSWLTHPFTGIEFFIQHSDDTDFGTAHCLTLNTSCGQKAATTNQCLQVKMWQKSAKIFVKTGFWTHVVSLLSYSHTGSTHTPGLARSYRILIPI